MAEAPLRPDLSGLRRRLTELEGLMADPATFGDSRRAAALGAELLKRLGDLQSFATKWASSLAPTV